MIKIKEYKVKYINLNYDEFEVILNKQLKEGWVLDSFTCDTNYTIVAVFFKM